MSASFENSAMKSSFSLSSLRSAPVPPGGPPEQLERPYHSLTKKRKEPCREAWRRSWGSAASGGSCGDDLWPLLQQHYDYIMDNHLIDTCKEANGELSSHNPAALLHSQPVGAFNRQWSLNQLVNEFTELCQWLSRVQDEIYSSPENLSSRRLRTNRMSELVATEPRRAKFIEQASAILDRIPEASAEVTWRVEHLNAKWEGLRLLLNPEHPHKEGEGADTVDTAHELRCLRRWLHVMEGRLPPPSLAAARAASYQELLRRLREHKVLSSLKILLSGHYQRGTGQEQNISIGQTTVSKYLEQFLNSVNRRLLPQWIIFPGTQFAREQVAARFGEKYSLPDILGCIDCTHVDIFPPAMAHQAQYRNRHGDTSINVQLVLQRDVECHGRIVSSVVRVCAGDAARALERRWHLLYLRAIEWQCHLEACLARIENQAGLSAEPASDSDEEPALKQPRLSRRGSPRSPRTPDRRTPQRRRGSVDSRQSCSEEEQEDVLTYVWHYTDSEPELRTRDVFKMADNMADNMADREVPSVPEVSARASDQMVPGDEIDGVTTPMEDLNDSLIKTPPTVVKRKKQVNTSKFNQTDRKSKHCATFYFRHHDTDSDRQMIETGEKSQEESSEEEWTYLEGSKVANEDSTDIMTSSVEIQCDLPLDNKDEKLKSLSPKLKLESSTPDLLRTDQNIRCKDIERLVIQAEELVQKQAQQHLVKKKSQRSFKPLSFDEEGKSANRAKMSRIKEWLNQSTEGKRDNNQGTESYDASGEYTTESEVDTSLTSEDRNLHSSMDMSTSTCTVTPTHQAKVQLRKKRATTSARPWSVSCLSQVSCVAASFAVTPPATAIARANMSISESALNTLASPVAGAQCNANLRASSTTVQGHVSSTNTMTEACTSCVEANDKQSWRRKRARLRRRGVGSGGGLVKSLSFCGRLSPEIETTERSAASDPPAGLRHRFDTTSTSGNDSDEELIRQQLATIANLRRSIEKTHITNKDQETNIGCSNTIPEQSEGEPVANFKLGPAGGQVRPRIARSMERERTILALSLGNPNELWDLTLDKDSDVDKSVNTGTEEHSSFSEQAWDFYQEKYNSENYSEAPDSDAARRLLEFGDDYRAFLDSQSDCCSSLSAQPENDTSPSGTRRRRIPSDLSRERSLPRHKRPTKGSPVETPSRKPKKSMSSAERKKNLLDSLERSRNNTSIESNEGVRRRKPENDRKSKRSPEFDLLNVQALSRRRHNSNLTSDEVNSSLEYTEVNNRPDILDSLNRRRRNDVQKGKESELHKVALTELRRRSTESMDSEDESSSPKKHSRRNHWSGDSDSESEEVKSLVRRSSSQLEAAEALMNSQESSPDLLRAFDYTDILTRCRENINLLDAALSGGMLSTSLQRDVKAVSARWSALRAAATRRGGARRLRREITALRMTLDEVCEPGDLAQQPHTRQQLHRRIEELKERLSRLLECKVSMLKLTVSVRRVLGDMETDDVGLSADLSSLLAAWDDAHQCTSTELLSLEKAVCAWAEWEGALRELQGALRGDLATLQALRDRGDQTEIAAQIRQLAASLVEKKKGGSTCDSLSDSGISDGDSEGAGGRARRLSALRELARRLQAALAPNSPAHRAIAKRMEQTENEVKTLQESCRVLVEQNIPDMKIGDVPERSLSALAGNKTGSGDPDYTPRGGWVWRVLRSSLPIQLCLVALLLAAWLVERPRCCDALNSLAQTLTPQLRYVRGPPPV